MSRSPGRFARGPVALIDEEIEAVTNVIDDRRLVAHLMTRDRIAAAPKRLAAVRVTLPGGEPDSISAGRRGRTRHEANSNED